MQDPAHLHEEWFVLGVNPVPWVVPPISVGRSKNGGLFPTVGRDQELATYQEALRSELTRRYDYPANGSRAWDGHYKLEFWFQRGLDAWRTSSGKTVQAHAADATNLQKATEDALQGVVIKNDRDVSDVHSVILQQGPDVKPLVVIHFQVFAGRFTSEASFPLEVEADIAFVLNPPMIPAGKVPGWSDDVPF
jgi:hypothetical protein